MGLLQIAPYINNPAHIMQYMNKFLLNQTGGNFVTAFYGIYNPFNHEFVYCIAGHNPPFIIKENSIELLTTDPGGVPLAIITHEEMKEIDKPYTNYTRVLEKNTKLLIYSDGLVETVNINDKKIKSDTPDFETRAMKDFIDQNRDLKCKEFIERMVERLIVYRGCDDFDDDVCIICLEIE